MTIILYLALLILLFGIALLWQSNRQRKQAGLPGGRVVYTDTRAWGTVEKALYDHSLGLTGKPDYLVQNGLEIEYPEGKRFAVCLTHDVDDIYPPPKYTALMALYGAGRLDYKDVKKQLWWNRYRYESNGYSTMP